MSFWKQATLAVAALSFAAATYAQVPQYGPNVTLDQARKAIAGAEAEARKIGVPMVVAVVDTSGQLVAFSRMDNAQTAGTQIAQDKAKTSAMYKRSTKAMLDTLAKGAEGWRYLTFPNLNAGEGGLPVVVDGKIVGAIGLSGGSGEQDGQCAKAGLDAMK